MELKRLLANIDDWFEVLHDEPVSPLECNRSDSIALKRISQDVADWFMPLRMELVSSEGLDIGTFFTKENSQKLSLGYGRKKRKRAANRMTAIDILAKDLENLLEETRAPDVIEDSDLFPFEYHPNHDISLLNQTVGDTITIESSIQMNSKNFIPITIPTVMSLDENSTMIETQNRLNNSSKQCVRTIPSMPDHDYLKHFDVELTKSSSNNNNKDIDRSPKRQLQKTQNNHDLERKVSCLSGVALSRFARFSQSISRLCLLVDNSPSI